MSLVRFATLSTLLAGLAAPLHAQSAGNGYLFGVPDARFSLRAGYARANAKSDLFDFAIDKLTLERSAFSGPSIGGDLAITVAPRLDIEFSADYSAAVRSSEDRTYEEVVGIDSFPIVQTTSFRRAALTANAILYLLPRGRSIGKLAWIPSKVVPWIGGGGGTTWYRFRQEGDFVDYQNLDIFNSTIETTGWAPTVQALAGLDVTLSPRFMVTAEARRTWSSSKPSGGFRTYDSVDLSGITGSLGLAIRL